MKFKTLDSVNYLFCIFIAVSSVLLGCSVEKDDFPNVEILISGDLNFGIVNVGQVITKKLTLTNRDKYDFYIDRFELPDGFQINYSGIIKSGSKENIDVFFVPITAGLFEGTIGILSSSHVKYNPLDVSGSAIQLPASNNWHISLGSPVIINKNINIPIINYYPDGHISVLNNMNNHIMFWAGHKSFRSESTSPFPEDHKLIVPVTPIIGGRYEEIYPTNTWDTIHLDNGGTWLYSVYRKPDGKLIGFAHLEYHWYQYSPAYKSIAVTYSNDDGKTWSRIQPIIRAKGQIPDVPSWSGLGDFCTVWDSKNNRWMCLYARHFIRLAMSEHQDAAPGTWKKYYNGVWNEPGLFGEESALLSLQEVPGGNPSVHYNVYLNKWIMVYHSWTGSIYISSSYDLISWDVPRLLIKSAYQPGLAWYPTVIGVSDVLAGEFAKIYYSDRPSTRNMRDLIVRTIIFKRND